MMMRPFLTHWVGRIADTSARQGRRFAARDVVTTANATRVTEQPRREKSSHVGIYAELNMERTYRVVVASPP